MPIGLYARMINEYVNVTIIYFIQPENLIWKIVLMFVCFFFAQVVLPFVEKYFHAHREYFVSSPNSPATSSVASAKEKEMTAR